MSAVDVRIGLPLPLSVVPHVLNAFGQMWPDTVIVTDHVFGRDALVIRIPDTSRFVPDAVIEAVPPMLESERELDGSLQQFDGDFVVGAPEAAARAQIELLNLLFAAYPDDVAPNYLEMEVYDRDRGESWVVTAMRPGGETPHRLREKAEAERDGIVQSIADDLLARIDREGTEGDPDGVEAGLRYALEQVLGFLPKAEDRVL